MGTQKPSKTDGTPPEDVVSKAERAVEESKKLVSKLKPALRRDNTPDLFKTPICGSCGLTVQTVIPVSDFDEDETRDEVGIRLGSRLVSNVVTCAACHRKSASRRTP